MLRPSLLAVLLKSALAGLLVASCASEPEVATHPESIAQQASAIQRGQATPGEFQSMAVKIGSSASTSVVVCSATLIAPNLVLTARHCLYNVGEIPVSTVDCATALFTPNDVPPENLWLSTNADANATNENVHRAAKYFVPRPSEVCGGDIALVLLKDKIAPREATPAEVDLLPFDGGNDTYDRNGTAVVMIGHGESTEPATPASIGQRNARTDTLVECVHGSNRFVCRDKEDAIFTTKEFMVKDGACPGDSGSGAYSSTLYAQNKRVVLGVQSRGAVQNGLCINDVYVRVDAWGTFIVDAVREAAAVGAYPLPAWAKVDLSRPLPGAKTPFAPGQLGAECNADAECESRSCIVTNDRLATCSTTCATATDCPSSFECVPGSTSNHCIYRAPPPPPDEGCTLTPGPSGGAKAWPILLALSLLGLRRRRAR